MANMIAIDVGKPITQSRGEMQRTAKLVEAVISCAQSSDGEGEGWRKVPLGVVAAITPWNNPVAIPMGKIAPALLYGNTVVWKPSPQASRVAAAIHDLALETLPAGVLQILFGDDRTARELMSHSLVDAITITGSEVAGTAAQEIASRRHVPLQAELGGNNAAIVWLDADLASSAAALAHGAFDFAGQRCTATRRLILHDAIYDQFLKLFTTEAGKLRCGDPLDEKTDIGPVVGNTAARIEAIRRDALLLSDTVLGGSENPSIILCSDSRHDHFQEESFGPLAVICRATNWDEAIALCNGVRQGLAAAVFTDSEELVKRFLDEARAGILKINIPTSDAAADLPFGGWKSSGIGPAEHGIADREFFTRYQAIYR
jgi:acyl-CoA reductase-like NAD-dependent aldehyde dehydrogenase